MEKNWNMVFIAISLFYSWVSLLFWITYGMVQGTTIFSVLRGPSNLNSARWAINKDYLFQVRPRFPVWCSVFFDGRISWTVRAAGCVTGSCGDSAQSMLLPLCLSVLENSPVSTCTETGLPSPCQVDPVFLPLRWGRTARAVLSYTGAASHMGLFQLKYEWRENRIKNSAPRFHWPHCKCSVETCGWGPPYGTAPL